MAVHNLGFRGWDGQRAFEWTRWSVITATGIRRAWQSRWLRRMLLFAWLPAVWFGIGFFIWEQSLSQPEWRRAMLPFLGGMPGGDEVLRNLGTIDLEHPEAARHRVWAWLLSAFFRYPQGVLMVLVVGLIAPGLISQDIRSRAFLLYFSRPLTRSEYIVGKSATVWSYLLMISALPAIALYVLGVLLSPELSVVLDTWDLPLRILAASVVLVVPTASLAMCFSSLTQETRYAGFAWFAVWILGWFTYGALTSVEAFSAASHFHQTGEAEALHSARWSFVSLYHTLGRVQSWIFGFERFQDAAFSAAILVAITAVSTVVLYRRISAPMRV